MDPTRLARQKALMQQLLPAPLTADEVKARTLAKHGALQAQNKYDLLQPKVDRAEADRNVEFDSLWTLPGKLMTFAGGDRKLKEHEAAQEQQASALADSTALLFAHEQADKAREEQRVFGQSVYDAAEEAARLDESIRATNLNDERLRGGALNQGKLLHYYNPKTGDLKVVTANKVDNAAMYNWAGGTPSRTIDLPGYYPIDAAAASTLGGGGQVDPMDNKQQHDVFNNVIKESEDDKTQAQNIADFLYGDGDDGVAKYSDQGQLSGDIMPGVGSGQMILNDMILVTLAGELQAEGKLNLGVGFSGTDGTRDSDQKGSSKSQRTFQPTETIYLPHKTTTKEDPREDTETRTQDWHKVGTGEVVGSGDDAANASGPIRPGDEGTMRGEPLVRAGERVIIDNEGEVVIVNKIGERRKVTDAEERRVIIQKGIEQEARTSDQQTNTVIQQLVSSMSADTGGGFKLEESSEMVLQLARDRVRDYQNAMVPEAARNYARFQKILLQEAKTLGGLDFTNQFYHNIRSTMGVNEYNTSQVMMDMIEASKRRIVQNQISRTQPLGHYPELQDEYEAYLANPANPANLVGPALTWKDVGTRPIGGIYDVEATLGASLGQDRENARIYKDNKGDTRVDMTSLVNAGENILPSAMSFNLPFEDLDRPQMGEAVGDILLQKSREAVEQPGLPPSGGLPPTGNFYKGRWAQGKARIGIPLPSSPAYVKYLMDELKINETAAKALQKAHMDRTGL